MFQLLVSAGADLREVDNTGYSLVHEVAVSGVLDRDLDSNWSDEALYGIRRNMEDVVKQSKPNCKEETNLPDRLRLTGIVTRSIASDIENMMATLIKAGCPIDSRSVDGVSPLYLAALNNHWNMLRLLLKLEADSSGETPLFWVLCGSTACMDLEPLSVELDEGPVSVPNSEYVAVYAWKQ